MERAPLHPVPRRPTGAVDPVEAAHHVAERLPALDRTAAAALALVDLAGRARGETAELIDLSPDELAAALARARKALRRSLHPLPGSGWCERAERLISDRLDDALEPPGPARLEVHLRNCSRCVEHERRLAQATDTLVADFAERQPTEQPGADREGPAPPPALKVVVEEPPPAAEEEPPAAVEEEPRPAVEQAEPPAVEEEPPPVERHSRAAAAGQWIVGATWYALFALAVALAVASVVLAVFGALGGEL